MDTEHVMTAQSSKQKLAQSLCQFMYVECGYLVQM